MPIPLIPAGAAAAAFIARAVARGLLRGAPVAASRAAFPLNQLKRKVAKHGPDFGVGRGQSTANARAFEAALKRHMTAPGTKRINGHYRNNSNPVTFFYNDSTRRVVLIDRRNNQFISGWKVNNQQRHDIIHRNFLR